MALTYQRYVGGESIPSPVYIDANVWVSHFVSARPKHGTSSTVLGDLLIQCEIMVSTVVFSEVWWAVLEHIYNEVQRSQNPKAQLVRLSLPLLKTNSEWLLPEAKQKLREVSETITSFTSVKMVPPNTEPMKFVPEVMVSHQLAPSDAVHFSLANSFAKSLFTEDQKDFDGLTDPTSSLVVYIV